jgi:hypothetical protein
MNNLERRMRDLEELVFRVVLEIKAETMAIRDVLIEKNLISLQRWDDLVKRHKTSYNAFELVQKIEKKQNSRPSTVARDQERGDK